MRLDMLRDKLKVQSHGEKGGIAIFPHNIREDGVNFSTDKVQFDALHVGTGSARSGTRNESRGTIAINTCEGRTYAGKTPV